MASAAVDMEFTPLESFHLLYKNLWSMNIAYRIKLNVIDTILFRDGEPYYWIFSSEQTGEIMKKKAERMESNSEIIRTLKQKSRAFTSSKEISFKNKVAILWYQENEKNLLSWIVDENELKNALNTSMREILCIQPYIGGVSFRGSGLFEHRAWTQKDGNLKHITYEMLCEKGLPDLLTSTEVEKWNVTEHQHGALQSIAKQLIQHIGFMNKCKVSSIVIQCVFTDQWVPHIVACKRLTFTAVTGSVRKDELIYPNGIAPNAFNPASVLPKPFVYKQYNTTVTPTHANTIANAITNATGTTGTTGTTNTTNNTTGTTSGAPNTISTSSAPPPPTSPSIKARNSIDTTHYSNYNAENDRRAAALQRQSSIKAELYIADALEEARQIANNLASSESAKFTRQGSTRTISPPRPTRKSYIATNTTADGTSSANGNAGANIGSAKRHPTDTRDTIRNNNRYEESRSSTPVNFGTSAKSTYDTNNDANTFTTANTSSVPSVRKSILHNSNGAAGSGSGSGSGKFVLHPNTTQKVTQRSTMFTPGRSSPTNGMRNSISGGSGSGSGANGSGRMSPTNIRNSISGASGSPNGNGRISPTNIRNSIGGTSGGMNTNSFNIVINTNNNWNTSAATNPSTNSPTTPFRAPLQRAHTTQLNTTTHTPAFLHTNTSPIHATNSDTIDINNMTIPAVDLSREPSRVNYNTADHYATVHMTGRPSMYSVLPVRARHTINSGSKRHGSIDSTMNSGERRASSATVNKRLSQASVNINALNTSNNLNATFNTTNTTNASTGHRVFRPESANSVTKLRKTIDKVKCAAGASTGLLNTLRRSSVDNNNSTYNTYTTAAVECMTEARHTQTTYHKYIEPHEDNNMKKLCSVFEGCRPISAPHAGRPRAGGADVGRRSSIEDEDLHFTGGAGNAEKELKHAHSRGNIVGKVVPFTGVLCHGAYCNFNDRAKSAAQNDSEVHIHTASTNCPYNLAYKSIIFCRAEVKVLGTDLDENIQSLLDQIRLSSVSTEVLYTYFVRRHLNKIAQRCQDEAKRLQVANLRLDPAVQQITDVDTVYRGLVYAEALASIHPSRFYSTVPTCEMCHRIYTYLDAERETIVLNTHSAQTLHTTALHTAEMQIERRRFASFARNVGSKDPLRQSSSVVHGGGRRKSERRRSSVMKVVKVANPHNEIAPGDEDPYQADDTVNSDQFVPHHTAQRDVFSDNHKKDNFASTLRTNVANIQFYAEQAQQMEVVESSVNKVHNVNNIDSGVIGNKNKKSKSGAATGGSAHNSPTRGNKVHSPTNSVKRHIIYNTVDGESIMAHVQDSVVLSAHNTPTAASRRAHNTHTSSTTNTNTNTNDVIENHTPYSTHTRHAHNAAHTDTTTPPHSARRKALLYRDNIPLNNTDININNTTHDSGIGSRGPVMKHSVNNITKSTATLSKWMNMLHSGTVHNLYTTTNPTTYDWEEDDVPYTKNTISKDKKVKTRPQSASAVNTKRSNSSNNTDSTVYGIIQYPEPSATNPYHTNDTHNEQYSGHTPTYHSHYHSSHYTPHTTSSPYTPDTTHHNGVEDSSVHVKFAGESPLPIARAPNTEHIPIAAFTSAAAVTSAMAGKRRPSSAGPVPYTTGHSLRASRLSRAETISVLENNLAGKMLQLAEHLQLHNCNNDNSGGVPDQATFDNTGSAAFSSTLNTALFNTTTSVGGNNNIAGTNSSNSDGDDDFAAAYAYSSLPFMAAPYLPSRHRNTAAVEDTLYTQLQIDPRQGAIIQPALTPAQIRQQQLEQEQQILQQRIQAERELLQLQRQQEYEQLQRDRAELQHAQRERANSVYTINSVNNDSVHYASTSYAPDPPTTANPATSTSQTTPPIVSIPHTAHPRVSFMATSANNSIFSTPSASPANRRRKRSVIVGAGAGAGGGSGGSGANSGANSGTNSGTSSAHASIKAVLVGSVDLNTDGSRVIVMGENTPATPATANATSATVATSATDTKSYTVVQSAQTSSAAVVNALGNGVVDEDKVDAVNEISSAVVTDTPATAAEYSVPPALDIDVIHNTTNNANTTNSTDTPITTTDTTSTQRNPYGNTSGISYSVMHSLEMSPLSPPLFAYLQESALYGSVDSTGNGNSARASGESTPGADAEPPALPASEMTVVDDDVRGVQRTRSDAANPELFVDSDGVDAVDRAVEPVLDLHADARAEAPEMIHYIPPLPLPLQSVSPPASSRAAVLAPTASALGVIGEPDLSSGTGEQHIPPTQEVTSAPLEDAHSTFRVLSEQARVDADAGAASDNEVAGVSEKVDSGVENARNTCNELVVADNGAVCVAGGTEAVSPVAQLDVPPADSVNISVSPRTTHAALDSAAEATSPSLPVQTPQTHHTQHAQHTQHTPVRAALFIDIDSTANSNFISPIDTTMFSTEHTPYTTRTTHTANSTTSTEPTVRNTIDYIDTNFISPVMSGEYSFGGSGSGGSDSGNNRHYGDSRLHSAESNYSNTSIASGGNVDNVLSNSNDMYLSSNSKYNNEVYVVPTTNTNNTTSAYSAEDHIYSSDAYDYANRDVVYGSEFEAYPVETVNTTDHTAHEAFLHVKCDAPGNGIDDVELVYTDTGGSVAQVEYVATDTNTTTTSACAGNGVEGSNDFVLQLPTNTGKNTENDTAQEEDIVYTQFVPSTPVYIHDLHNMFSEQSNEHSGSTTGTVNHEASAIDTLLSPLAEPHLQTVTPHPHSPPSRAQERPFEMSGGDSFKLDQEF